MKRRTFHMGVTIVTLMMFFGAPALARVSVAADGNSVSARFQQGNNGWIQAVSAVARRSGLADHFSQFCLIASANTALVAGRQEAEAPTSVMPEVPTLVAGGLLLIPFAASMIRFLSWKRT